MIVRRLKNRSEFIAARNGVRSHQDAFVLQLVRQNCDPNVLQVGFTVTKKIGNAVERNRIKRRLRAAVGEANVPGEAVGYDAVLIARRAALDEPFDNLVTAVGKSLRQALHRADLNRKRNQNDEPQQCT